MAITGEWERALHPEFKKPYYAQLYKTVLNAYRTETVYPPGEDIFNAFQFTPLERVKVVILGQDPYHEPGQANGLCFSVRKGIRIPPSLVNIYKELSDDLGCPKPESGDLTGWARQGVLLLNTVLTVRAHEANSHRGIGWEEFTDAAIRILADLDRPLVFILWGGSARKKKALIHNPAHLVIESPHPSPLSASGGFFGSRPFSRTNAFLTENGLDPVDWAAASDKE
ncbi:MAG: uracil-DNA glycosylase [Lachnospiraceae bacterium]|nr:uracil-DNA glycosylase [Lachnospiraceae bacterium]